MYNQRINTLQQKGGGREAEIRRYQKFKQVKVTKVKRLSEKRRKGKTNI